MKYKKLSITLIFMICVLLLTSCNCNCNLFNKKYEVTYFEYFDTITSIIGYESNKKTFEKNTTIIKEELAIYNKLYDIYYEYDGVNNLCTINKNAGIQPVQVDQKIIDLLQYAKKMYDMTDKMVNIAMGSVLKLWHDAREYSTLHPNDAYLPTTKELKEASMHMDIEKIIIDEEKSTVYLADKDMQIDVGAIAKGYVAERIAKRLKQEEVSSYVLDIGGNIRTIGTKKKNEKWTIGIKNPNLESEKTNIQIVEVAEKSVVTSGSYQRYFTVNGIHYHHIISPITLYPIDNFTSVTVITSDSGLADALSTALFNLSIEEGKKLIDSLEDVEAMWIDTNYQITYSKHFLEYVI